MSPQRFVFPDLVAHCPYQLRIHPDCDVVNKESEEWIMNDVSFTPDRLKRFLDVKAGVLTAYCYCDPDFFRLRASSDYLTWLFCVDDWTDEFDQDESCSFKDCILGCLKDPYEYKTDKVAGRLIKEYVDITLRSAAQILTVLFYSSFFRRFLQTGGPRCAKRFIDTMDLYLDSVGRQAADRTEERTPDLESYIILRRDTSACRTCFALMEFANGIDLPDEVSAHPLIREMEDATNDLVSWSNVSQSLSYRAIHPLTGLDALGHFLLRQGALNRRHPQHRRSDHRG